MVKCIVIPAVSVLPVEEREFSVLQDYQEDIAPVVIAEPAMTIYVNEAGKPWPTSLNQRATALWWLFDSHVRGHDLILGDGVLLLDDPDREADLMAQLQRKTGFRVEVQLREPVNGWITGSREFRTWFDAAKAALVLEQRLEFIAAIRVASD